MGVCSIIMWASMKFLPKACPKDETITGTGALKVDTKVYTTRGMGLPGVDELELEG